MERETELAPRRISDLLVLPRSSFSFRRSSLDDDISVSELSLKEWAPAPVITRQAPPSPEKEIVVVSDGTLKGNIRTRYLPLDPNDDCNVPHGGVPTKLPSPEIKREEVSATGGGLNGGNVPTKLPTEDEVVQNSPGSENGHLIHLSPGRALPKPIAFDINFDDSVEKKQGRTAPLKVSFMDGLEIESPNVPAKSPTTKARGNASQKDTSAKSSSRNNPPPWERSTKVGLQPSPVPKKIITPTSHGLKIKKGVTAVRPRGTNAAPSLQRLRSRREYTTDQGDYHTDHNLVTKSLDSSNYGGWERHSSTVIGKSLDSNFFGGGEYDSTSKLITKSLSSPSYSSDEIPKSGSRVYVPRNNGGRKSEVEEEVDDDEDAKVAMLCGNLTDTNRISGDLGRLFSKFRRPGPQFKTKPSGPLRSASDPSIAYKITKSGSAAPILSRASLDSTIGAQKYSIGSHASMKVLQECCSGEKMDTTSAYSLHKPRKIRDHEPHRHYYKTITMTLEQKLKG